MTKTSKKKDFDFIILSAIDGTSERTAAKRLKMSQQNLQYYTNPLKKKLILKKIGYGTWQVDWERWKKTSKKTKSSLYLPSQKEIRGHYWQIKLKLPHLPKWNKRRAMMDKLEIKYKPIHAQMESTSFNGTSVWFSSKSIIVHLSKDIIADTPDESYSYAIYEFEKIIKRIESLFKVSLKINKRYQFKVGNSHYAILRNWLAKQYNKEKKKLYVFDHEGCWLICDFSEGQDELEGIGKKAKENTTIVQDFFNDLKRTELKPSQILQMIGRTDKNINNLTEKLNFYAENNISHVQLLKDLNIAVNRLSKAVGVKRYKRSIKQRTIGEFR